MSALLLPFRSVAQLGRATLPVTLIAGALFQDLAKMFLPFVPIMVFLVLAVTAFRVGHKELQDGLRALRRSLVLVLILQMAVPFSMACFFLMVGIDGSPPAISVVLVIAAPAIIGSSTLAALMKANPEPAFRTTVLGHILLPLTMVPLFLVLPELGNRGEVILSAGKLLFYLLPTVALGLILRALFLPTLESDQAEAVDGLAALLLMLVVFGLMGALGPSMRAAPLEILALLGLAIGVNFGLQIACFAILRAMNWRTEAVPLAIAAGNRNASLFIIALPPDLLTHFLVFLGAYQVPMFLTPLVMRRFFDVDRTRALALREPPSK